MKELLYICNAHAGKSAVKNKIADIVDCFIKEGYHVSIHITQSRGDAAQIAASRGAGVDRIVCSGGDGTLNEVISGLMQLAGDAPSHCGIHPRRHHERLCQNAASAGADDESG